MAVKPYTSREKTLACLNALAFVVVVALNALGSTGRISGYAVGEISDFWSTKFTPASSAFSIWGLIYAGVALFVLLPIMPVRVTSCCSEYILHGESARKLVFEDIGFLFIISCVFNASWILLFVQRTIATVWVSVPLLFGLMITLQLLLHRTQVWKVTRSSYLEKIAIDFTFSVYAGWSTVASIVNVCAALVASGWDGSPWTEEGWSILLMVVAALINLLIIYRESNPVHALVYVWAVYWIGVANNTAETEALYISAYTLALVVLVVAVLKVGMQVREFCQNRGTESIPQQGSRSPLGEHSVL